MRQALQPLIGTTTMTALLVAAKVERRSQFNRVHRSLVRTSSNIDTVLWNRFYNRETIQYKELDALRMALEEVLLQLEDNEELLAGD
jgi:cysteinyl-tRNA synthetase